MNEYEIYKERKEILENDYEEALKSNGVISINEYKFLTRCDLYKTMIFEKYKKYDTFTKLMSDICTWDMELLSLIDRLEKQYKALKNNQSLEEVEKAFYKYKKNVEQNN